jgi:hypothetical protein
MENPAPPSRRRLVLTFAHAALAVVVGVGLLALAALGPAPAPVLPLVLLLGIGSPMLAAWELRLIVSHLGRRRPAVAPLDADALAELLRRLDQLPETPHPLVL